MSYRVARRTNEIGIRLALGATRATMMTMVLCESGRLVASGLLFGLLASLATARFVSSRLFGVGATDPLTFGAAAALLITLAAIAAFIPALRASRVDPMVALRCE